MLKLFPLSPMLGTLSIDGLYLNESKTRKFLFKSLIAIQCVSKPGSSFSMIFNVCPNFKVPVRLFLFMRHTRLAWPSCNSTKRDVLAASAEIWTFQICMLAELVLYSCPSTKCRMGIQQENFKTPGRITLPWLLRAFS